MYIMKSNELSIWNYGSDVVEELLPFALLMIVSVCEHDFVSRQPVGDLCSKATRAVALALNVIILDMAPVEQFGQSKSHRGLATAESSDGNENDILSDIV